MFLCATALPAQTTLGPGDIAITEFKIADAVDDPSNNDEISLVILKDCVAGTKFVVNAPPIALCQNNLTLEIDANGNPTTNGQPFQASDLDNGSNDPDGSINPTGFSVDITPGCANVTTPPSATTITLTVTDNLGSTAICTSQVTVEDNIAPEVTCQNVAFNLGANGNFITFRSIVLNNILTSFTDNCAAGSVSEGITQSSFTCNNIGVNPVSIFFRDRPQSPTSQEDRCNVLLQINDPLGVCGVDPTVNCQPFTDELDANGNYVLDANSLDNGSTDDRSVYSLVFSDETATIGNATEDNHFANVGYGQSFTATMTGVVQTIKVRFFAAKSNATIHLYNGGQGSGTPGSVGAPDYTQTGVELFAGPTGGYTEILLTTPFPVVNGQQYTFAFEGNTDPYYDGEGGGAYTDGEALFGYATGFIADLQFEVDFIGPTTMDFTTPGVFPTTVYAVDDQGNVSPACMANFTLDPALPVEWLSFGANAGAKKVDLAWETSEEPDNAGFHIERSPDGRTWSVLGEQAPLAGNTYDYTDATPLTGENYYRVRQTDFDGAVTYSPVEVVTFTGKLIGLLVAPNPVSDVFTVRIPARFGEGAQLELIDITGRAVRLNPNQNGNDVRFNAGQLARGVYLLRALSKDGKVAETVRVVLQ